MKVILHLRGGVTPARFLIHLRQRIRSGEIRAWEVTRSDPSTVIRRVGRFRSSPIMLKPGPKRRGDGPTPDVVASLSGKDAVLVLRYFVYLIASKLGDEVEGFFVPIDEPTPTARARSRRRVARAPRSSGSGRRRRA